MMKVKETYLFRLPHGKDVIEALLEECHRRGIKVGFISVIGAVKEATIGYYDQKGGENTGAGGFLNPWRSPPVRVTFP